MATAKGLLAKQEQNSAVVAEKKSVSALFNEMLDKEGIRGRINDIMGKRAPQFTASLVSLVNSNEQMQQVFRENPVTIIQSALKAASYDLPVDPSLGFAYILPFSVWNKTTRSSSMQAQFIMGYRGLLQLAMRTGAYKRLNVTDIRESELISYNRLTEDIEIEFIVDGAERAKKPIIGYVGYYRLVNGMEKTLYMTVDEIKAHEEAHRKGKYQNPIWADTKDNAENFKAMCMKTVLRKLIGKWGIMSIDYQTATPAIVAMAENAAKGTLDDEEGDVIDVNASQAQEFEAGDVVVEQPVVTSIPVDFEVPMD